MFYNLVHFIFISGSGMVLWVICLNYGAGDNKGWGGVGLFSEKLYSPTVELRWSYVTETCLIPA